MLLINIKQRSVQQSTISVHELPNELLRILSIFRGKFYCLSLVTAAVDINVETLKENGILLSQFAQNIVETHFFKKYNRLRLFTRKLVKNKVSRNLPILLYDCFPINNIYRPKNRILF